MQNNLRCFAFLLLIGGGCGQGPATDQASNSTDAAATRPNLLIISIDSLRADHLGLNGYVPPFTPNQPVSPVLDRFASTALVYDQAWSSSSWTLPAHASMFTGLDEVSHGVIHEDFHLDPQHQTFAERLTDAGYHCFGVYSGAFVGPKWNLNRGFERYESAMMPASELEAEIAKWRQQRTDRGLPEPTEAEIRDVRNRATLWDVSSARVNARALKILQEQSTDPNPFFLFLHYYDCHYDYVPERGDPELASLYDPEYRGTMTGIDWLANTKVRAPELPRTRRIAERDLLHVEALYDTEIRWVDLNIGQILDELQRLGLQENTVVAIVSDHGDEFFDHGSIGHRSTVYTELTQVLMMIHLPADARQGIRISQPAGLLDLPATLLDALQLPAWPQSQGRSLLPPVGSMVGAVGQFSTASIDEGPGVFSHLFVHLPSGPRLMEAWRGPRFSVIRPFVIGPDSEEQVQLLHANFPDGNPAYLIYDRQSDPSELRAIPPTSPAYAHAVGKMRAAFLLREEQRRALAKSPLAERRGPRLSEAEHIGLQALGYIDGMHDSTAEASSLPLGPLPVPELSKN